MTGAPAQALVALLVFAALAAEPVRAGEMLVQGDVVEVVPIMTAAAPGTGCQPAKPPAGADLVTVLRWDLRRECGAGVPAGEISGYRVRYRWDGRVYSRVMAQPPGETVTLRVHVR